MRHSTVLDDPDLSNTIALYGRGRLAWGRYWNSVYETISSFAPTVPTRSIVVRYEDVVSRPKDIFKEIISLLRAEQVELNVETGLFTRFTRGFQDPKIRSTRSIHQSSVGRWTNWTPSEIQTLWSVVGTTAEKFGYRCPQKGMTWEECFKPLDSV